MRIVEPPEEAPATAKPAPALEYKPEAPGRVTVRGFRLLLALTLLNTTLLGMSVMGPQLFPFLRAQWQAWHDERAQKQAQARMRQTLLGLWQQCAAYVPPAGYVAYDEDPAEALRLIREGGKAFVGPITGSSSSPPGWAPPARAALPDCLAELSQYLGQLPFGQVLFLHERTAPGGSKCLVLALFDGGSEFSEHYLDGRAAQYSQKKTRRLYVFAWRLNDDGTAAAAEKLSERQLYLSLPDDGPRAVARRKGGPEDKSEKVQVDYGNVLRWHGGEADPADAGHFTLRYTLDGHDAAIDGWLRDDRIDLQPREGEWTFDRHEILHLRPPPTTQPAAYPR